MKAARLNFLLHILQLFLLSVNQTLLLQNLFVAVDHAQLVRHIRTLTVDIVNDFTDGLRIAAVCLLLGKLPVLIVLLLHQLLVPFV